MPGCDTANIKLARAAIQFVEFQKTVAVYAWVRGFAVFVCTYKLIDDFRIETVGKIKNVVRYAEATCDTSCILHIVKRTAGMSF